MTTSAQRGPVHGLAAVGVPDAMATRPDTADA